MSNQNAQNDARPRKPECKCCQQASPEFEKELRVLARQITNLADRIEALRLPPLTGETFAPDEEGLDRISRGDGGQLDL
jgi:hypothetical protein